MKPFKSDLFALFDQDYNTKDPGEGREKWATKRDLEKVFMHPRVAGQGFDYKNTLIVDSDGVKIRDYPLNSVVLKPYSLEDLFEQQLTGDYNDSTLPCAQSYLLKLLSEANSILDFISSNPFKPSDISPSYDKPKPFALSNQMPP